MKKKLAIVLSCALAATLLFGCTSKEPTTTEGETQQETTTETDAADGELTAEQFQTLYDGAFAIYKQIVLEGFEMSTTDIIDVDGYTYNRVTDERFSDMEAFRTYLGQYFTQNMMDTDIFAENNIRFTEGKGGGLYVLDGARGTNIFYAGYVMGEPVKTETGMSVTATAYYTKTAILTKGKHSQKPLQTLPSTKQQITHSIWYRKTDSGNLIPSICSTKLQKRRPIFGKP